MTLDKRARLRVRQHCGQLNDDDGVDPHELFKTSGRRGGKRHKALQLCRQVGDTLSLVLAGEFADQRLHGLQVVSVDPAPDASQLCVSFRSEDAVDSEQIHQILSRLAAVSGRLRCAVAEAIHRRRTPQLLFRVIGPTVVGELRQP